MTIRRLFRFLAASLAVAAVLRIAAGANPAFPGTSAAPSTAGLSAEQRARIRSLHETDRAAVDGQDRQVDEPGHDPSTLARARERRAALRQTIFNVIQRHRDAAAQVGAV